ncbi:MAG: hypothetical protein P4N59_29625 [Negativicutes bacterium]|nr:hypothetical protein [Negativicutes bacterium]
MDAPQMIHQLRLQLWDLLYAQWQEHLFSAQWWFIVAIMAISYALWWKFVEKPRLLEILLFGCFIAVARTVMEDVGVSAGFWSFNVRLVPMGISLFLNDLTVVPLTLMIVYQYTASWKQFLIWIVIAEGLITFAFHPFLSIIGIYREWNWHLYYTFMIMMFIAVLSRAVLLGILNTVHKYQEERVSAPRSRLTPQPAMKPLERDRDQEK